MMQLLRNNLSYKVLSILLGIGVWLYVLDQEIETDLRARPVDVKNVPEGYVATVCQPQEVQVMLRGNRQVLDSLRQEGVSVVADLSRVQITGPRDYAVRLVLSQVPTGVGRYWEVSPATATVTLEPIEVKQRTVAVERIGVPNGKYQVASTTVQPETVTVEGARSAIHEVQRVVASVDVTGLDSDQTLEVPPQALGRGDVKLSGVTIQPGTVNVDVRVRPVEFRVVPVRPNVVGSLPDGFRIESVTVEPLVVTVRGDTSSQAFSSLTSVGTDPLDVSGETGTVRRSVALRAPAGVSVISTRSCHVTVRIGAQSRPESLPTGPSPEGATDVPAPGVSESP